MFTRERFHARVLREFTQCLLILQISGIVSCCVWMKGEMLTYVRPSRDCRRLRRGTQPQHRVGYDDVLAPARPGRRGPRTMASSDTRTSKAVHLDLSSAGRQPMLSSDGQVSLVFNGAIIFWSFELVERNGARFRSHTDTEVLLHGYAGWELNGWLRAFRGMFAIALWDDQNNICTSFETGSV